MWLFQIPQRYRFSSKSQPMYIVTSLKICCFRYHKGTDFQANHNSISVDTLKQAVVLDTTKVQIFKQITTVFRTLPWFRCCFRYHKGTDFQANHNNLLRLMQQQPLFQIPQRYRFSSKSQPELIAAVKKVRCFRYHKGTDFQANHNTSQQ